MRVILVGCEYVGTTTLAHAIDDWLETNMGVRFSLIHDHWKIPHTSGHPEIRHRKSKNGFWLHHQNSKKCTSDTVSITMPKSARSKVTTTKW